MTTINALPRSGAKLKAGSSECIMVRSGLQGMRKRQRRWIALLAAFALLFNQITLAQHLCLHSDGENPRAALGHVEDGTPPNCHADSAKKISLSDTDASACAAHCSDADKQTHDVPPVKVPDLVADGSEMAQLRPLLFALDCIRPLHAPNPVHSGRPDDHCVLLI